MTVESTVADFWSELLKGLHRATSHPIPCLDGDPTKYACILPDVVTIRAKLLQCTLQDLPSDYKCGCYASIQTPNPTPSLRVSIPYIEMHSSTDTDVPGDEVGNTGDVFVIEAPPKPSFWVRGPEKWLSVNDNVLSEHPFVNGFKATYREGTIVWEKLTPLKPARRPLSKQQPPLTSFGSPPRTPQREVPQSTNQRQGVPSPSPSVALPASLPSTPTMHGPSKDSVDSAPAPAAAATLPGPPIITSPGLPLKRASCPTSEASTAWRDTKRARFLPDEAVLQAQAISRKRSTSGSVSSESAESNFARREGRPASFPHPSGPYALSRTPVPAPSSDVKTFQLMIQQRGESIKRQNEELGILRKRNAELCSENVTITKAIREIVGQFKSLKERQEEATQELRTDLAETRAKHDGVTQQMDAMQQQHQEANKAHAFSLDVVTGLRHTLSWQKNKNWKLQKECDEINHRHAEKYTKSEDLIQKAKENLLHSHASEATLREETERLQGELDDSVLVAEGLQLELDDERATCGRLRDEVQRLEAEVKTLLARTESAEAPTQLPVNGRRLQSLPPLLHSSIAPFLGSICDAFSKIQDDLQVEKERADSASDMYANERDAHVEFKMTSEQQLEQATRERDAALRTSQSSQRELSEIRETLGKLSRPSPP